MAPSVPQAPIQAPFRLYTFKQGLLSALGHDLCFAGTALVNYERRADTLGFSLRIQVAELKLLGMVGQSSAESLNAPSLEAPQVTSMSAQDERKIVSVAMNEVLDAKSHPTVQWCGEMAATDHGSDQFSVEGTLTLRDREAPQSIRARRAGGALYGFATLQPSRWGIAPYRAMLGALCLEDRVCLKVEVPD